MFPQPASLFDESPSDLLAALAGVLTNPLGDAARLRVNAALDRLSEGDYDLDPPRDWLVPARILCSEVRGVVGDPPFPLPNKLEALTAWLHQLQRLDRWHAPLLPHNGALVKLDEHDRTLDRFYGPEERFNRDPRLGLVIPGRAPAFAYDPDGMLDPSPSGDEDEDLQARSVLLDLLDNVAFLPCQIEAADADDDDGAARPIAFGYRRAVTRFRPIPSLNDELHIAVAPLAEAEGDLVVSVEGAKYRIHPAYPPERIAEAVRQSVDKGAHLLCLPEMSIDEMQLPRLKRALVEARRDYFDRTGRAPRLRYVAAGVVGGAPNENGCHRNYIVLLDANGNPIHEQDKLSHWNLNKKQLDRFGLRERFGIGSTGSSLLEGTRPGERISIVDLDGLGRLVTLICADMNQNLPGDWLLTNFHVDWLYAPIMDGSTCWTQGSAPWIIKRAARAAKIGRTRVVVTNSVTMTHWNNSVIEKRLADSDNDYCPYDECGIALLIEPAEEEPLVQHVAVPMKEVQSPVVETRQWNGQWSALP